MCVPTLYGYASIIFRAPAYALYAPALAKLVLFSSVIHQLTFTCLSTLPFAIGQVQDAGLLFLSKMASIIAVEVEQMDENPAAVVSTCIVLLGLATSLTGLSLIILGKAKLARIVGYIPVPVVGGYLAYIGYFCLQAGVALCISEPMPSVTSWSLLLTPHNFALAVPGLITGMILCVTAKKATSASTLPIVMTIVPVCFYLYLYATGTSIATARSLKYVGATSGSTTSPLDIVKLVDFSLVYWSVAPKLFVTWGGMVAVVGFSSVLDVAAIAIDMGEPLNTDSEIISVGVSNFISGLFGGFTGSYIFSKTIFQYRTKVWSRWVGVIVAIVELVIFALKVDLLSFSPLFFFGATLIFIGFDLLVEWLYDISSKVTLSEYLVLISTFGAILIMDNIDFGVILGITLSIVEYTVSQGGNNVHHFVKKVERRSRKVRSIETWRKVQELCYSGNVVTFELRGVLYFGNSLQLLRKLMDTVGLEEKVLDFSKLGSPIGRRSLPSPSASLPSTPSSQRSRLLPKFVVLDFHAVQTVDSSAVRSIAQFVSNCKKNSIKVLMGGANIRSATLLTQGSWGGMLFESVSSSLEFCENNYLGRVMEGVLKSPDVTDAGAEVGSVWTILAGLMGEFEEVADGGDEFYEKIVLKAGSNLFTEWDCGEGKTGGGVASSPGAYAGSSERGESFYLVLDGSVLHRKEEVEKGTVSGKGGVVGYVDFFAGRHRTFTAIAGLEGAVVAKFNKESMKGLEERGGRNYVLLERYLLRTACLELCNVNDEL